MWEVQCYEVIVRAPTRRDQLDSVELTLRVSQPDLDAVLRTLASSGVESFHVRRIPILNEIAGQMTAMTASPKT